MAKKICLDDLPDLIFPAIRSLLEFAMKLYQIPSKYLKGFKIPFPTGIVIPKITFPDLKIPSLEALLKISDFSINLPLAVANALIDLLEQIIDTITAGLTAKLDIRKLIPSPLIPGLPFDLVDFLPPFNPKAIFEKFRDIIPDLSLFNIKMSLLIPNFSLLDLLKKLKLDVSNLIGKFDIDLNIKLIDLELPTGDLLGKLTLTDLLNFFSDINFLDLRLPDGKQLRSFLRFPELDFNLGSIVDKIRIPKFDFEGLFPNFKIPLFDIPGLLGDMKLWEDIKIPSLKLNTMLLHIATEINKLIVDIIEAGLTLGMNLIQKAIDAGLSITGLPSLPVFPEIPTMSDILELVKQKIKSLDSILSLIDLKSLLKRLDFKIPDFDIDLLPDINLADLRFPTGIRLGDAISLESLKAMFAGLSLGDLRLPDGRFLRDILGKLSDISLKELFEKIEIPNFDIPDLSMLSKIFIPPFPALSLPSPLLPDIRMPDFEFKFGLLHLRNSMIQYKLNLLFDFIEKLAKLAGIKLKLPTLSSLLKIPRLCVTLPDDFTKEELLSTSIFFEFEEETNLKEDDLTKIKEENIQKLRTYKNTTNNQGKNSNEFIPGDTPFL